MVFQDAYGTVQEVKKDGCYLGDFINAHELQTGKVYNQLDLNEIYYAARETGIINPDCFINSAYSFCVKILRWDIIDVRKERDPEYQVKENEIEILLMRRYEPSSKLADKEGYIYHFILRGRNLKIYDTIEGGSITAKSGELHTKRIIVLREKSRV